LSVEVKKAALALGLVATPGNQAGTCRNPGNASNHRHKNTPPAMPEIATTGAIRPIRIFSTIGLTVTLDPPGASGARI
jgi:hypothetical protein